MAYWVIVVDDDETNLKLAGRILSMNGMKVTAFKSGQALLDYTQSHDLPDLVLLDIKMPNMDGFETLERFHAYEKTKDVPVIFLTGDENRGAETKGLSLGAMDFIKKPFIPEVLTLRVRHIIKLDRLQKHLEYEVVKKTEEAKTDAMTGMLNKAASEKEIQEAIAESDGMLMMVDLDSFKLVNDIYGHEMGDKVLIRFAKIIHSQMREEDIAGRIGGDEFVVFFRHTKNPDIVQKKAELFNREIIKSSKEFMGENMEIPIGVSAGVVRTPDFGTDYEGLISKADEALYQVKQNGKHGIKIYDKDSEKRVEPAMKLAEETQMIYAERSIAKGAFVVNQESFRIVYRYIARILRNYPWEVRFVVFEISSEKNEDLEELTEKFVQISSGVLRSSDTIVVQGPGKVLMILLKVGDENWTIPVDRVMTAWRKNGAQGVNIKCDAQLISAN